MKLRFAPSPTGWLHVGNARIAIVNALLAIQRKGQLILRLDDTDTERSRPEFAQGIEDDLRWLGISWHSIQRQQDRTERYALAAEKLKKAGLLYPCFETEEELKFKREQRLRQNKPPIYDRGSLKMTQEQFDRAIENGKTPHWRFKLGQRPRRWDDGVLGERQVKLTAISDPVLVRADGSYLYTFCSVVDDLEMGITHIVRGEDHVTNTGVQLDIYEALGGDPERIGFAHLPLLTEADGGPLSKRIGSLSLRQMRKDGVEPQALVGYLAALGTSQDPMPGLPVDLAKRFDILAVSKSSARFDARQMLMMNKKLLHAMSFEDARARLPEGATPEFWHAVRGNLDMLAEARLWWDVVAGRIAPPLLEGEGEFLKMALATLPAAPWDTATWSAWTEALRGATERKGKALFLPLRLALTGEEHGPDMKELLPLIGRERVAERLKLAVSA
ncbi:glutamate--tRNA ligase [Rhodovarius crocodyli]|uniref:Glutamate--tRNA ligase n=1 Tax=Rhodovarius crocodyli TaxID=1979269 RepID=A0A437MPK5_9PROT|nr:glutamate--tRNA ligase [Rhodovarius crocodyli]RVT99584.1 glutamate--tRNA ligase [Rhodovarius crocodyli]